ncbi:MAG: PAS domain-containing protein, partial [Candidatus Thorarchaeota archaeon]
MNDDIPASVLDSEREDLLWYRSLVDSMHDALAVVDNNEIITYTNKRFCELLKYSDKELIGKSLFSFLVDDSKPILEEQVRKRREGEASQYEVEWITKDGIIIPTIAAGAPITSEDGSQGGSFAVLTDITERKKAEDEIKRTQEALKISEEKYRTLSERSLQGLTVIQDGTYVYVNKAFGDIVGYSPDTLMTMHSEKAWDMIHPHDKQMLLDLAQARNEGRPSPARYEYRFIRKDGPIRWVEAFASIIEIGGKKAHQVAIIDITERKAAEMRLRAS